MKIILGIGNPGRRYEATRHNVGFRVVDTLAAAAGGANWRERFGARTEAVSLAGHKVLLVKPQTYVNRTGEAARAACDYYDVPPRQLLVVVDDANLPLGKIRLRAQGSAGGHNGLQSLIERLGTEAFHRLRIGIGGRKHPEQDLADHVLSYFDAEQSEAIDAAIVTAADACRVWLAEDIETCMNRFNPAE